mgnify:CR=1 FL=1
MPGTSERTYKTGRGKVNVKDIWDMWQVTDEI